MPKFEHKEFKSSLLESTLLVVVFDSTSTKQENKYKELLKALGFNREERNSQVDFAHNSRGLATPLNYNKMLITINSSACKVKTKRERMESIRTAAHECIHFLANSLKEIAEHSNYIDSEVNIRIFEWAFMSLLSLDFFTKKVLK